MFVMFVMEGSRLNITYLCQVLKHWCKVENKKIVDKCSSIVLVEKTVLGTFQGAGDELVPSRVLSGPPPRPAAVLGTSTSVGHLCGEKVYKIAENMLNMNSNLILDYKSNYNLRRITVEGNKTGGKVLKLNHMKMFCCFFFKNFEQAFITYLVL